MDYSQRQQKNGHPDAHSGARSLVRSLRLDTGRNTFSRDTLEVWARWTSRERQGRSDGLVCGIAALILHVLFFASIASLKHPAVIENGAKGRGAIKVTLGQGGQSDAKGNKRTLEVLPQKKIERATPPQGVARSTKPKHKAEKPRASADFGARIDAPSSNPVFVPIAPDSSATPAATLQTPDDPASQVAPPVLPKGLRRFLPGGSAAYLEKQRGIGKIIGEGPIGGDMPEAESTPDPENRPVIVEREYSLAHYFDSLGRRFSDAWGSQRTLPSDTTFQGVVGEYVEYDIVINRNGSLRKIVNVSARRHPWRRYEDVDRIVFDVFSNVFPMEAVPQRILQDPVVIRKRIQYTGASYSIF